MTDTMILHGETVTREQMENFKAHYDAALARGLGPEDTYDYYGQEVLVSYAKYVIEYAELKLGPLGNGRFDDDAVPEGHDVPSKF